MPDSSISLARHIADAGSAHRSRAERNPSTEPQPVSPATGASNNRVPTLRRWAWLIILTIGLVLFELVHWDVRVTGNPNLVPSLLLLGAVVVPASFAAFLYGRNARVQVGAVALIVMAALGGLIGVLASGYLEYDTLHRLGTLPMLAVAVIEEAAKLLAPALALLVTRRAARPADGFILGVACGAGFAVLETLGYSAVALLQSHENIAAVDQLLFQRGLLSPATHMAWTGLTAAALYAAAQRRWSLRALLAPPAPSCSPSRCTPAGTPSTPRPATCCSPRSASPCSPPRHTASTKPTTHSALSYAPDSGRTRQPLERMAIPEESGDLG